MNDVYIVSETVKRNYKKREITGKFKLSNGTTTKFDIDLEYGWEQYGNCQSNMRCSICRVEELQQELIDNM